MIVGIFRFGGNVHRSIVYSFWRHTQSIWWPCDSSATLFLQNNVTRHHLKVHAFLTQVDAFLAPKTDSKLEICDHVVTTTIDFDFYIHGV